MCTQSNRVWYHGTRANFDRFAVAPGDVGIHVGSKETARRRLEMTRPGGDFSNEMTIPVFVKADRPLRMGDAGSWDSIDAVVNRLSDLCMEDDDFADRYEQAANSELGDGSVAAVLMIMGYDSIVYENVAEGGGESLLVLDPRQISMALCEPPPTFDLLLEMSAAWGEAPPEGDNEERPAVDRPRG